MPKTYEPLTLLGRAWAQMLEVVPAAKRARAMELALMLHGEYVAQESASEAHGYRRGLSEGKESVQTESDAGFKAGWERGYQRGLDTVIGHTGAAARGRSEDDPVVGPEPPPAC